MTRRCCDQPAGDFDAGSLCLRLCDRAASEITIDFRELVAVDGEVAVRARSRSRGPLKQRPHHGENRCGGRQP